MEAFILAGLVVVVLAVLIKLKKFPQESSATVEQPIEAAQNSQPLLSQEEIFLRMRSDSELDDMAQSLRKSRSRYRAVSISSITNFNETEAEAYASEVSRRKADELDVRLDLISLEQRRRSLFEKLQAARSM